MKKKGTFVKIDETVFIIDEYKSNGWMRSIWRFKCCISDKSIESTLGSDFIWTKNGFDIWCVISCEYEAR